MADRVRDSTHVNSEEAERPSRQTARLSIQLLGSFSVSVGDRILGEGAWELRKAKSLVKLLALSHDHRVHREQAMELLWPELDPQAGSNNLHKALHVARRVLEPELPPKSPSAFLHSRGEFIELDAESLSIDAETFREHAERAHLSENPTVHNEVLAMYGGDLLPEDLYEDWTVAAREQLSAERQGLLLELAGLREQQGDIRAAIEALRSLVTIDPAHEDANARLMRLYARSGSRHLALRQYRSLEDALREELDAQPGQSVQSLHQEILRDEPAAAPERELPAPIPATPIRVGASDPVLLVIGREAELERLQSAVEGLASGEGKLLLLGGEAGIGKTRLVAELLEHAAGSGVLTLYGCAVEGETQRPFGSFIQAFEGFAVRVTPARLETLLGDAAPELASIVPIVGSMLGKAGEAAAKENESWRTFAAISRCLERLASHQPVLFVLDNVHASDEASLYLLDYLATTVSPAPVLFVAAFRPEELAADGPVSRLERNRRSERVDIGPLGRPETEQLVVRALEGQIDSALVDAVWAAALGNPYYVHEAIRALEGRDALVRHQGRWSLRETGPAPLARSNLRRRGQSSGLRIAS